MQIHLKARRPETSDVITFIFDLGGQPLEFSPGQFIFYELDDLAFPDERGKRRHFTISNAPSEKGIVQFTTKLRGSGWKETLRQASLGYELTLETPKGRFVLPEGERRRHVFIAGGIGITPYRSMLREAANIGASLDATLFYFNPSEADTVFRQELEEIAAGMPSLSLVHVLSQPSPAWQGETGRLTPAMLERHGVALQDSLFLISGPPGLVKAYGELLQTAGVPDDNVRKDSFTGYD